MIQSHSCCRYTIPQIHQKHLRQILYLFLSTIHYLLSTIRYTLYDRRPYCKIKYRRKKTRTELLRCGQISLTAIPKQRKYLTFFVFCKLLRSTSKFSFRKEVIQPQVPLRLPCYDLVPVTELTVGRRLPRVGNPTSGTPSSHHLTGGVYKAQEHIHRVVADTRLLAIPTS